MTSPAQFGSPGGTYQLSLPGSAAPREPTRSYASIVGCVGRYSFTSLYFLVGCSSRLMYMSEGALGERVLSSIVGVI